MNLKELKKLIKLKSSKKRAEGSSRFFKTKKGEYGHGDFFLGITVPESRKLAALAENLELSNIKILLNSKWHEERFMGIIILVNRYSKNEHLQKSIFEFYLKNLKCINNWDLVDSSADKIIGHYFYNNLNKSDARTKIISFAESSDLWERRVAILSCFYYIKMNDYSFILLLSKKLIKDEHDLIHKALGWMLREVGKRDLDILMQFINKYKYEMPRTMLRYAIEKINENERKEILRSSNRR